MLFKLIFSIYFFSLFESFGSVLFINAYIDKDENRIVFSESSSDFVERNIVNLDNVYNTPDEFVVTNCERCGGSNKIEKGKSSACEYCGSPIM